MKKAKIKSEFAKLISEFIEADKVVDADLNLKVKELRRNRIATVWRGNVTDALTIIICLLI